MIHEGPRSDTKGWDVEIDFDEPGEPEEGYEQAWMEELARRVKSLEDGTAELLDWREAMAELRRELAKKKRK